MVVMASVFISLLCRMPQCFKQIENKSVEISVMCSIRRSTMETWSSVVTFLRNWNSPDDRLVVRNYLHSGEILLPVNTVLLVTLFKHFTFPCFRILFELPNGSVGLKEKRRFQKNLQFLFSVQFGHCFYPGFFFQWCWICLFLWCLLSFSDCMRFGAPWMPNVRLSTGGGLSAGASISIWIYGIVYGLW